MKIKRLEICGFKSFVDKTVLTFDGRITGILGPNGCGKSNVVDAIQWASGEQRPKQLRGKEMADVIFAGSESRQPTSMAEVTITFDNDGSAPEQFAAYSEIQVTRRLYRSGESEYLLNKTPCRLRDIQELLMDAGIGRGSVSVIQQGKVGLIVSSAPGERRSIIEEAAGISKYKAKKRQAVLKMEHTEQNLLRVKDILSELERQIRYLDRQAKKAERFRRLKDEMRELELKLSAAEYTELCARLEEARKEVAASEQTEAGAAAKLTAAEGEIEVQRLGLEEEEKELQGVQEQLAELNSQIAREEQQLTNDRERATELASRAAQAQQEASEAADEAASLAEEIERATVELTEAAGGVESLDAEVVATGSALAEAKQAAESAVARVEELKAQLLEAAQQVGNAEHQLTALDRRRAELGERLERATHERDGVDGQVRSLESQQKKLTHTLGELKQFKLGLEEERNGCAQTLESLKQQLETATGELNELRDLLSQKRSRLESLQELQNKLEGYGQGVRSVIQASESGEPADAPEADRRPDGLHPQAGVLAHPATGEDFGDVAPTPPELRVVDGGGQARLEGIYGLVADRLDVPAELEAAVEAVLGPKLQTVLVEGQQHALEAIEYLKGTGSGRATFLPEGIRTHSSERSLPTHSALRGRLVDLVSVESAPALADYLFGDVLVVETLEVALEIWRAQPDAAWDLVTLDGSLLDRGGAVTGGTAQAGAGLLARRRQIDELTREVSGLRTQVATTEQRVAQLTEQIKKTTKTLEKLVSQAQDEELKIVGHSKDLQAVADSLGAQRERLDSLSRDVVAVNEQLAECGDEEAEAKRRMAEGRQLQGEAEQLLVGAQEQAGEAADRVEQVSAELTRMKVELASLRERRDALAVSKERLIKSREELSGRSERLTQTNTESVAERGRLLEAAEDRTSRLGEMISQAGELKDTLTRRRGEFEDKQRGVRTRESELRGVRDELEKVRKRLGELTVAERELSMRIEHLEDAIGERYDEDLEENARQWVDPELDVQQASDTLDELKQRVSKMGEVNTAAIDEYEEVIERQKFLSQQRDDLEKSLAQLKDAIAKINKTTRQRFMETFEAVNSRFQEVFPRMFRGGRASLILTDPNEPLETGIDIVVQPPGKKLQNINLLSGGEKALTAVSLIVGIFLVRPTPFCLLDEVDAPLDDANVGRFNEMVQEMSLTSQFIIITHNKGTMSIAENLYGVTMQEPGVSKVVNVKFDGGKVMTQAE